MLEAVDLFLVINFKLERFECVLELAERHNLARVVRRKRGALESLAQDLVAGSNPFGVECCGEELASSLKKSVLSAVYVASQSIPS